MTTFVLVHGAWGGPHTFRNVRRRLWAAGHEVFTPGLTGLGERAHLISPLVDLRTHTSDLVNHLEFEDLRGVVLVGYSYGGMVVTDALRRIADRVAHLVYLDAHLPGDGQSVDDLQSRVSVPLDGLEEAWLVPPRRPGYPSPNRAWLQERERPHPRATMSQPVILPQPLESYPFTRTYIKATDSPRDPQRPHSFWVAADHARTHPAWRYREIATNHVIDDNDPDALVELLLELTEPTGSTSTGSTTLR